MHLKLVNQFAWFSCLSSFTHRNWKTLRLSFSNFSTSISPKKKYDKAMQQNVLQNKKLKWRETGKEKRKEHFHFWFKSSHIPNMFIIGIIDTLEPENTKCRMKCVILVFELFIHVFQFSVSLSDFHIFHSRWTWIWCLMFFSGKNFNVLSMLHLTLEWF